MSAGRESASPARWTFLGFGFRGWAALAVLLHVAGGLLLFEPILHPGGDNAIYMILGEALRTGEGYRDLYLPTAPLHTKYPPFYPALLGVLGWVGGAQVFKLASLALTGAAVGGTAFLGRRLAGEGVGLAAAGLLAVNPVLLEYSHWALSEAPFVCLVVLALLWLTWAEPGPELGDAETGIRRGSAPERLESARRDTFLAFGAGTALAVAAFLTRTAGLALLASLPVALWWRGHRRRALVAAGAGAAALGGWALFQRLAAPDRPGYIQELLMADPYDPAAGSVGLSGLLVRAARNVWTYLSDVLPGSLGGGPGPPGTGAVLLGLLVAVLALAGWAARARRQPGSAELFAVAYGALIALWPVVWTDRRFLLPLLPLVLIYACAGAAWLAARLVAAGRTERGPAAEKGARWRATSVLATAAVALPLAALAVRAAVEVAPERIRCLAAYRAGEPCDPPAYASLYAAARWAASGTPPDAVVVNRKPSLFYWYGRRRGDVYPFSTDPDVVLNGLEAMGADYVVVDQVSATTFRYLVPAVQAQPNRFEVAYRDGDPVTLVLRFLPPARIARGADPSALHGGGEEGARYGRGLAR